MHWVTSCRKQWRHPARAPHIKKMRTSTFIWTELGGPHNGDHGRCHQQCVAVQAPKFRSDTPSSRCPCVPYSDRWTAYCCHVVSRCCLRLLSPEEAQVKVKVNLEQATKAQRGSRGIAVLFNLGARWGWVVSAMPRPLYPRERTGTHCTGGWVGLRADPERCEKSLLPPGLVPRTVQPVASRKRHSSHWEKYLPDHTASQPKTLLHTSVVEPPTLQVWQHIISWDLLGRAS